MALKNSNEVSVAPLAGAWIETTMWFCRMVRQSSLPSRERGLKLVGLNSWLESGRRSPRGSVD